MTAFLGYLYKISVQTLSVFIIGPLSLEIYMYIFQVYDFCHLLCLLFNFSFSLFINFVYAHAKARPWCVCVIKHVTACNMHVEVER